MKSNLVVMIDDKPLDRWFSFAYKHSLDHGDMSVNLKIKRSWRNDPSRKIERSAPAVVYLDDIPLLTGYVHRKVPDYDEKSHQLVIVLRSKLIDVIEATLPTRTFINQSLVQIAETLCKPFGIRVLDEAGVAEPFQYEQVLNDGESPWAFLEELARIRAVRLIPTFDGNLAIVRAGKQRSDTVLKLGENIQSGSGDFSEEARFSHYHVMAQQQATESLFAADDLALQSATAQDAGFTRYRPATIVAHNPMSAAECQVRANWQLRTHAGRSQSIVYKMRGFHQDNGQRWQMNWRVPVVDPYAEINNDMLISELAFTQSDQGEFSELRVAPPEAYDLTPLKETKTDTDEGLFG